MKKQIIKKKLNIPQFLLVLNGPPTAGKSSVGEVFYKKYNNIFFSQRDSIKNMISGYNNNSKEFLLISHKMQLQLIETAIKYNLHIVLDQGVISPSGDKELGDFIKKKLKNFSKRNDVKLFEFNIEASFETLEKRFYSRLKKASQEGTLVSLNNFDKFKKRYELYHKQKKSNITFSSDEYSPEEIFKQILVFIKNSF